MTLEQTPIGWYDRLQNNSTYQKQWRKVLLNPGLAMQASEFNEIQTIQNYQFAALAGSIFADGTFLNGGGITTSGTTVTFAAGQLYAYGFVHDVPTQNITITGSGTETIQLVITEAITTGTIGKTVPGYVVTYDANLLDQATGAENIGYPGADRLIFTYSLALNSPGAGPTIATYVNGQLEVTTPSISLTQLLDLLETYFYETLGSYVAVEPTLTFQDEQSSPPYNPTNLQMTVTGGVGYVQGIRYANTSPTILQVNRPEDGVLVSSEPHTYTTGTDIYTLAETPMNSMVTLAVLRQSGTLTMIKGATNGSDSVPSIYWPVSSLVSVYQGATTYTQGTDYQLVGNTIHWLSTGSQPATSTSYSAVIQYIYSMVPAVRTLTTVTNESHTYASAPTTLSNADLQSMTTLHNVTTNYTLVLGTDYTVALNTGIITYLNPPAVGNVIQASYQYWAHTTEGDFVSRDAFVDGSHVNQIYLTPTLTPTGLAVNYQTQFSLDTTSGNVPLNSSTMFATYKYNAPRIDILAWHVDGTLKVIKGTAASAPVPPSFTAADMPISLIQLPGEASASYVTYTPYGNLAVSEITLNTFQSQINALNTDIAVIDSNLATLFAGIPYFVININHSLTPYTISNLYAVHMVDASGGNVVLNLPQLHTGARANIVIVRTDSSGNTVTVNPYSGQTILGLSSLSILSQWTGYFLFPDASNTNWVSPNGANKSFNIKWITSSGSYTPTPGTKQIGIAVCGAGGGGGGSNGSVGGSGGGGGATAFALLPTTGLTFPATVTVGTGGSGGAGGTTTAGSNGGNSEFTTTEIGSALIGFGGEGGYIDVHSGNPNIGGGRGGGQLTGATAIGSVTVNSVAYPTFLNYGGPGGCASATSAAGISGNGGDSFFSGGGCTGGLDGSSIENGPITPLDGSYGAGGWGHVVQNSTTSSGNGQNGLVVILEILG